MNRRGKVFVREVFAGWLAEQPEGYRFVYDATYLALDDAKPVSLTLPLRREPYTSAVLFPFFFGLLAEGILKETQCRQLRLDENDHFGRLLKTASSETIGSVTVEEATEGHDA